MSTSQPSQVSAHRPQAVFIGGAPRSGTTLLGGILGTSADAIVTPESQFKLDTLCVVRPTWNEEDVLRYLAGHTRFRLWEQPLPHAMRAVSAQAFAADPVRAAALVIRGVVRHYATVLGKPHARYWIDHTPNNLRYALTFSRAFEEVRFVHLVRDGRAVARSVMPLDWGPNTILRAADMWAREIAVGVAAEQVLGPSRVMRVHYEQLLADPMDTLERLCQALGLEFRHEMLERPTPPSSYYRRNYHTLVGGHLQGHRADAWRTGLNAAQVAAFESATGDLLEMLGYELSATRLRKGVSITRRLSWEVVELFRGTVNHCRFRWRMRRAARPRVGWSIAESSDSDSVTEADA